MNKNLLQSIRPLVLVFIFLTAFFITGKGWLEKNEVNQNVLIIGNLLLFLISLTAFLITNKALSSTNPQAFVRAMYSSFIIKFFVLAITAFVYIMVSKKNVNKPALVACAGFYIIYTGIETRALMKMLKQKKNG